MQRAKRAPGAITDSVVGTLTGKAMGRCKRIMVLINRISADDTAQNKKNRDEAFTATAQRLTNGIEEVQRIRNANLRLQPEPIPTPPPHHQHDASYYESTLAHLWAILSAIQRQRSNATRNEWKQKLFSDWEATGASCSPNFYAPSTRLHTLSLTTRMVAAK